MVKKFEKWAYKQIYQHFYHLPNGNYFFCLLQYSTSQTYW